MSDDETLDTYDRSALKLAQYFKGIGPRVKYIERTLDLAGKNDGSASVLEIGCGDGRDAMEIIKRVGSYTGIDYSEGLVNLAKALLPTADFRVVDMQSFEYPADSYDAVIAFAPVLHIDKSELTKLFSRVASALKVGGIFYISTKYKPKYSKEWKEDEYGRRLFYYYSPELIARLSSKHFEVVFSETEIIQNRPWTEIALSKR